MASTTDDAVPKDEFTLAVSAIGATVQRERKRQHLSVQALSQRSGVSFGSISELERGLGNPSMHSLHRLASALGIPLGKLMEEPGGDEMVVRADDRHLLPAYPDADSSQQVVRELLSPRGRSTLQLIRSTLPPGFTNEKAPFRHLGTESVVVECGVLVVQHGDRSVVLQAGDAMTYGCSTPHWWANGHDGLTIVLGAVTPFEE